MPNTTKLPDGATQNSPGRTARNYHIAALTAAGMTPKEIENQPNINIKARQIKDIQKHYLPNDKKCLTIMDTILRQSIANGININQASIDIALDPKHPSQTTMIKHQSDILGITGAHTLNQYFINANIGNDSIRAFMGTVEPQDVQEAVVIDV